MSFDLSIVIPTCNRAAMLERCLDSLRSNLKLQIIVVDGASTDVTPDVLSRREGAITVIREPRREGFVRAVNKGFRSATGRNLMWLNDDARPLPGALELAVDQLENAPANVGLLALFHDWHSPRNVAYETIHAERIFRLLHVRGTLYANFGMGRRSTFEQLGFFDERYYMNGADPDFSLKVWSVGMRVEPAYGAIVDHDEHHDDRRAEDLQRASRDNELLFNKWNLPPKSRRNDFDPARPCTLIDQPNAAHRAA